MTDREVRALLADLVDQDPPVDVDVDLQLTRGRRRARRRTAVVVVALALPIAAATGTYAVTQQQSEPVVLGSPPLDLPGEPVAKAPKFPWGLPDGWDLPSESESPQSKRLASELKQLTPELKKYPQAQVRQFGWYGSNRGLTPHHSAVAGHRLRDGAELVVVHVEMVDRKAGFGTPWVCESEYEKDDPCDAIRKLPDGSYAFVKSSTDKSAVVHGVRLVRPNGTQIMISSTVRFPYKNFTKPVLSPKRLIEIASKITVKP
ncbi:hypothetical protein OG394_03790 [Kribbella sp. NBC_01245]|uniref:hypothetical protein n=1 Tax=Kribbella sp. NBC_01245 TaxID=2903578 RepID=UPI002E2CC9A7|nr:hypothetical protein [Kribbella sp. NBC_01245]